MIEALDRLLLQPLLVIYASMFSTLPASLGAGGKLIAFGIVLNLALLPLYAQMERRSRRSHGRKENVARDVARMKTHFHGRERYFYIRTVYRQHRYHPISELLGSADLFLQILVFATVFQFISRLGALPGASFGPITDLSQPDALLHGINLLPLLMTIINITAVFAYIQDRTKRWQACVLAIAFLLLLYDSASGLVLYWTTNNLFSLVRGLIQRHAARFAKESFPMLQQLLAQR